MPNLEYLYLQGCTSLEEVHHSLKYCKKLIQLNLSFCSKLERFPYVNVESLESLNLNYCSSLEKFPEILGRMKQRTAREIMTSGSWIRELSLSLEGLVKLDVSWCSKLESLPEEIGDLENLEYLDASYTLISRPPSSIVRLNKLKSLSFGQHRSEDGVYFVFPLVNKGLLSLEYLDLSYCNLKDGGLPEDIGSLSSLKKLYLGNNFEHLPRSISKLGALEYLNLSDCKRLTQLPEDIGCLSSLKELHLKGNNFEHLPQSISELGALEYLNLSGCKRLTQLPEDIGSLSSLEELYLQGNNFEHLPQSISKLGALQYLDLSDCKRLTQLPEDIGSLSSLEELYLQGNNFEHLPQSISELGALQWLELSDCKRLTQLPEDIGSLSSLEELYLQGNNFEHLPQSISKLGALQYLDLSDCERLTQLPEFPQQLHTIYADWSNDLICNSLFQNISSLQHDISVSEYLSLRVFRSWVEDDIPSWFNYQGMGTSVSVNLPENWYVSDNFLGFAVCYYGDYYSDCITAHLIPLCDDGMSSMTQEFALSNNPNENEYIHFLLVSLDGLWDASNANEKTPNDYGCIEFDDFGENMQIGVRLWYKNESEVCIGIRKSRDEEEATCSSSKKQRQLFPRRFGL
uniref:Leucine Rich Repeat family protein n=1 Tax=Solanum tuberosum TaxID=4113 RepID=M1D407_SOLTU